MQNQVFLPKSLYKVINTMLSSGNKIHPQKLLIQLAQPQHIIGNENKLKRNKREENPGAQPPCLEHISLYKLNPLKSNESRGNEGEKRGKESL